jgi:hypothetical protein
MKSASSPKIMTSKDTSVAGMERGAGELIWHARGPGLYHSTLDEHKEILELFKRQ